MDGSKETAAFFILLRAGLWERKPESLAPFPLSPEEWDAVFRLASFQTVTGILYEGISHLPDALLPPEERLFRLIAQVDALERRNQQMNGVLAELYAAFTEQGIQAVLQKGQGVAACYGKPLLRECGDIDFYFPTKEGRAEADALVRKQGVAVKNGADGSIFYEWKGIKVEHHSRLIDLYNPFVQGYLKELERQTGFVSVRPLPGMDTEIAVPAPPLNLLLLNAHILKHALGWGVGLRQLCDMARAYCRLHTAETGTQLPAIYRKAGIERWSHLLHGFLTTYVGLPETYIPEAGQNLPAAPLLEIVQHGGNFGYANRLHAASSPRWRKVETSRSFFHNLRFACRYAPKEALGLVCTLLTGQLQK